MANNSYKLDRNTKIPSKVLPGVTIFLRKMTEGRRLDLRSRIAVPNAELRKVLNEQDQLDTTRDFAKWWELQDRVDEITMIQINPVWIEWGVAKVDGLEQDEERLDMDRWKDWPSVFFREVLDLVKEEADLNGQERKNSQSSSTSGKPEDSSRQSSSATTAVEEDSGNKETAESITNIN